MARVKICGITNLEDAQQAISLGADALGFNFYKCSPRYLEPSKAKLIIEALPPLVSLVCIFVDEFSPDRILSIAHAIGIGSVQLHGSEAPEYVKRVSELRVIKAFRVVDDFDLNQMAAYSVGAYLLDGFDPKVRGGTGKTFDWTLIRNASRHIVVAGGLDASNVAMAISTARPWGVDACSRLESAPGRKDHAKVAAFVAAARAASLVLS